jgi:peptide/nickel transport system permease protein
MVDAELAPASALPKRGLRRAEKISLWALALTTVLALTGPLLAPHDPTERAAAPFLGPGDAGLLGTDDAGRDVFSRVLAGIQASWLAALGVVAAAVLIGGMIGVLAGTRGGRLDSVLMRVTDLALALPAPVLAIAIVAALGPGLLNTLLALTFVWWALYARLTRGEARALVVRPHFDAARLSGSHGPRLVVRHVLPGVLPTLLVAATLDLGVVILTLAGLSFIGLGAPPPAPELGAMAARGQQYLLGHPWIALAPALAVFVLACLSNLAGDGLRTLFRHS